MLINLYFQIDFNWVIEVYLHFNSLNILCNLHTHHIYTYIHILYIYIFMHTRIYSSAVKLGKTVINCDVLSGVLLGRVLGPLFFFLYATVLSVYLEFYFFLRDFIFKKTLFEKLQYLKQEIFICFKYIFKTRPRIVVDSICGWVISLWVLFHSLHQELR